MEIIIAMSRKRLLALADEIQAVFAHPDRAGELRIEAKYLPVAMFGGGNDRVGVEISNDDMERPEVEDLTFVDIVFE